MRKTATDIPQPQVQGGVDVASILIAQGRNLGNRTNFDWVSFVHRTYFHFKDSCPIISLTSPEKIKASELPNEGTKEGLNGACAVVGPQPLIYEGF